MSAKKRQTDADVAVMDPPGKLAPNRRALIIGGVVAGLLLLGGVGVWRQVRAHVMASGQYQIDPEQITLSPPPPWIRTDIRAAVMRDAKVDGPLSLLDSDLTIRMAAAFSAHPWVSKVERVSKRYPAGLDVVLSYRKPIAMVEVQQGTAALPIDSSGVVLPTADFTAEDAENYLLIGEIFTTPAGPTGSRWGDAAVLGAAKLAEVLADDWKALGLFRIVPSGRKPGRTGTEPVFSLITRAGTLVEWGRSPATDMPGELAVAEKLSLLKRYAAQNNNSLDLEDGSQLVIRDDGALIARPRPSIKPLPKTDEVE